ncbi:substrate-binding domain-containing protein [Paenarthrobacter sp. NPDC089316]|uniref:substrate-binding domain-containing protein n=1 Tax=unclassified Paenarthrobacter TaxID=2634190 RepID=UPI0034164D09
MFAPSRSQRMLAAASLAGIIAVTAAGCSNGTSNGTGGAASASGADRNVNVIVVSGPLDDPYFGAIKRGTDDAAKQAGVTAQYLSPSSSKEGSGPTLARLVQDAINKKPDALVVANFFPDAENAVIKQATAAGIPVILQNTGNDIWKELGAKSYVGLEPRPVGVEAANQMTAKNIKKVLCVNPVPGNPFLEQACEGLTDGMKNDGGAATTISIPYSDVTNPTKVKQSIQGALKADPSIEGVFVFGSAVAENAKQAAADSGMKLAIGTGDLSTQVLKDIQSGDIAFALDSQPYLQGYYPVLMAAQYVRFGIMPAGEIVTGPNVVTQANVADVLKINQETKGIRGAS